MTETTEAVVEASLPPYSGEHTACAKCRKVGALTRYRPAASWPTMPELNGRRRPGPLPERLERECCRCDFQWDEDLPADDRADGGLSIDELAQILDACASRTGHAVDHWPSFWSAVAEHLAETCAVYAISPPPVWQPEEEPPPAAVPQHPEEPQLTPDQRHDTEDDTAQRLRAAAFTAAHWHQTVLDRDNTPAAHAIACIRAALNGQTDPTQLGLDNTTHNAFHAALTTPAKD